MPPTAAPSEQLLGRARLMAFDTSDSGIPIAVTPTADGGVNFEWHRNDVEYTAELDPDGTMFLCSDNLTTDAVWEWTMSYDRQALVRFFQTGAC